MATESSLRIVLKGLMILICVVWVCLWVFKPTELWTKIWHKAEDNARNTVLGYYGLDFVVYSFPIIALAIVGFIYLHLSAKESRNRDIRMSSINFSNPVIVRGSLGIISGFELLVAAIFTMILVWTIYAHISNDFKKKKPVKSLKLNDWQFKFSRFGTRFGLLAEVCLALLLLPVLRGMALFRLIGIQFEASVRYHVFLGTCMIFFATLHGSATFFIWGIKQQLQTEIWKWQKTGRVYLAGEIALISGLVIWVTSLPQIRRKRFEIFYYTHHLYTVFIVFFLFHAGDRHFYMVFSGVFLFALDKLLRVMQSRPIACVVSARILPCKAIELTLAKDPNLKYTPTSVIFLKVPSISKLQWHPFSITSSSSADDERLSIIVKGDGGWTNTLYSTILDGMDSEARHLKCLPVSFEGPYGPVSMDFLRYDSLLLVAGGIGITPFLSILQELYFPRNSNKSKLPTRIQLIYAVKKSQDISLLNSVSSLLLDHSLCQPHLKVNIFVTQEGKSGLTFRELLSDSSQIETINFDTGCSNYTNLGLVSLPWMAIILGLSSIFFLVSLVCLNHVFLHHEKKSSEKKNLSWITNVLLLCSLIISTTCSILVLAIIGRKNSKKNTPSFIGNQSKKVEFRFSEIKSSIEEHEIHYGGRPSFEDIFSEFTIQTGGSDVGVFVCGPESMNESVGLLCQQKTKGFAMSSKRRDPCFSFHSLNFAL